MIGSLGGDAHLDALDAARLESERRIAERVQLQDARREQFGEARFGVAPGAQDPALDHGGEPGASLQIGQHGAQHHGAHLVGHAGDGIDHLGAGRADQARGGAGHLGNHRCALRHVRLAQVVRRHRAPACGEQGADPLRDLFAAHQRHTQDLGDRLAGDIVLGRTETAAQDHRIAALERLPDAGNDAPVVVADLALEVRIDPGKRQLAPDPGRVGVDDLAEQQLRADGDDFAAHGRNLQGERVAVCRQFGGRSRRDVAVRRGVRRGPGLRAPARTP